MKFFSTERVFDIKTNGRAHTVKFEPSGMRYNLYVDGELRETFNPSSTLTRLFGDINDYEFMLDGACVIMAMRFGRVRVAVDGFYVDNGEEFAPVLPSPVWSSLFVAAALTPPIFFKSNFLDFIVAGCFAYLCTHYILKNPDFKITMRRRIIYCILAILVSWAFFGLFFWMEAGTLFGL